MIEKETIEQIHHTSLDILERTGFRVENEEALAALSGLGCEVDLKNRIAKIPRSVVNECLRHCPRTFTLAGRNPKRDIELGSQRTFVRSHAGSSQFVDPRNAQCRMATRKDLTDSTRVLDALPNVDFCGAFLYPNDEVTHARDVATLEIMLNNTDKHLLMLADSIESFRWMVKIAQTVAGGTEELSRRPIISIHVGTVSPLQFDRTSVGITVDCAKNAIPLSFYPTPITGATGPVTLAGQIALTHAEMLGCISVSQSVKPGAPVFCAPRPYGINMRTGTALLATMEHALATSALIQLEHFVGLPTDVLGFATESKTLDMQSGIERTYAAILAYLAGADILSGAGGLESVKTGSLEQLAIDDEICSVLKRMRRGIEVTDITLGVDLVDRIGIGGNYLSDIHTRKFFRSEHLILELFDHDVRAVWEASGRKDMAQRAREKALKILGEHQPAPLDKVVEREVRTLMQLARRELGG